MTDSIVLSSDARKREETLRPILNSDLFELVWCPIYVFYEALQYYWSVVH